MRRLPPARSWLLLLIPVVVIFGPALLTSRTFGLRDAGHYYGPLWRFVHAQWQDGVPLWNPLEENGRPLAADVTASVFYPAKIVFALPVGFDTAMEIFVIGHIALALVGAFFAAKSFRLSHEAASLAALSYALSGSVVFLHCNPVFLVGAAWLPVGIGLIQRSLTLEPESCSRSPRWPSVLVLGAVLAMMVLGGDPQTAYLLMLIGFIRVLVGPVSESIPRVAQLIGLASAALVAFTLAAVQILPSYQWAQQSDRATYDAPRSLTEFAGEVGLGQPFESSGLFDIPRSGSHRAAIYQFSVGPWRWLELLWPNFGGRPFPENQRWIRAIPAEGRYWTPTLYIGLLPILLGLTAFRVRRSNGTHPQRRWLITCTIFFALASLGYYGMAWMIAEIQMALGVFPPERWGPIGGVYWLMTVALPGFVMFRYPAKLWIVVAVSLSLLAAMQADRLVDRDTRGLRRILVGYLLLSLIPLLGVVFTALWPDWMAVPGDSIYGPFDVGGAIIGALATVVHGVVVAGVMWWMSRRHDKVGHRLVRWIALITAVDLTVAHLWLVPTVPSIVDASLGSVLSDPNNEKHNQIPPRYLRWTIGSWYPQRWGLESDRHRLAQVVDWDRRTVRPKYNLDRSMGAVQSYTSFSSAAHRAMVDLMHDRSHDRSLSFFHLIDALGTQYVISPADVVYLRHLSFHSEVERPVAEKRSAHVWRNDGAFPRAWIVHESQRVAPPKSRRREEQRRYIRTVLLQPGEGLRQKVLLDAKMLEKDASSTGDARAATTDGATESCQIVSQRGGEMILDAQLNEAGYVVVSESYAPGWKCVVESDSGAKSTTPVLRANGVMCALALSEGQHRLTMRYRPRSFVVGATISAIGWCLWFAMIWFRGPRPRISLGP